MEVWRHTLLQHNVRLSSLCHSVKQHWPGAQSLIACAQMRFNVFQSCWLYAEAAAAGGGVGAAEA
jgi:hypothetical protein